MHQRIAAIPVSMLVLPQYCCNADAACNALQHCRNIYCCNIEVHCRNAPFVASLRQCCYCKGHCGNALWHCRNTPIFSRCNDKIKCAFRAEMEDDPHYKSIINYLRTGEVHLLGANKRRQLRTMAKKYTLRNDELYYKDTNGELKLCLAQSEVPARGDQTFPKSTEIRNSVAFRAHFSVFFRPCFSVVAESVSEQLF